MAKKAAKRAGAASPKGETPAKRLAKSKVTASEPKKPATKRGAKSKPATGKSATPTDERPPRPRRAKAAADHGPSAADPDTPRTAAGPHAGDASGESLAPEGPHPASGSVGRSELSPPPAPPPAPSRSGGGDGGYVDGDPGPETRAVMLLGGIVQREQNKRVGALVAVGAVVIVAAVLGLDFVGVIRVPGLGAVYDFTGVQDPNRERASARTEPAAPEGSTSEAERARLRAKLMGTNKPAPKSAPTVGVRDTKTLSAEERALTAEIFADSRKREGSLQLKPPAEIRAPNLPNGLTQEAIAQVIGESTRAMGLCIAQAMKAGERLAGKMEIELTIVATGTVGEARVVTPAFDGSVVGSCAVRTAKRWRFPRFNGEPVTVVFPYVLSAS